MTHRYYLTIIRIIYFILSANRQPHIRRILQALSPSSLLIIIASQWPKARNVVLFVFRWTFFFRPVIYYHFSAPRPEWRFPGNFILLYFDEMIHICSHGTHAAITYTTRRRWWITFGDYIKKDTHTQGVNNPILFFFKIKKGTWDKRARVLYIYTRAKFAFSFVIAEKRFSGWQTSISQQLALNYTRESQSTERFCYLSTAVAVCILATRRGGGDAKFARFLESRFCGLCIVCHVTYRARLDAISPL